MNKANVLDYNDLAQITPINNKGDLMRLVFTKEELRNVDSAIPIECWKDVDTTITVMDYNDRNECNRCFGKLTNLLELAYAKGIDISTPLMNWE